MLIHIIAGIIGIIIGCVICIIGFAVYIVAPVLYCELRLWLTWRGQEKRAKRRQKGD